MGQDLATTKLFEELGADRQSMGSRRHCVGIDKAVEICGVKGGYLTNPVIRIACPTELTPIHEKAKVEVASSRQ